MWWLEWRRHERDRAQLGGMQSPPKQHGHREACMLGLLLILLLWAAAFLMYSVAAVGNAAGFWEMLGLAWPVVAVLLGMVLVRSAPHDPVVMLGRSALQSGRPFIERLRWDILRDNLVKAFFLPIMVGSVVIFAQQFTNELRAAPSGVRWFAMSMSFLYLIDVTFATVGYLSTFKRLGAHIRNSNPYLLGWVSALVCYPPFFTWLGWLGLMRYKEGPQWHHWLESGGPTLYVWGGAIIALKTIYAWATIVFGIRFSNLTHRGIITHGPFRWTKHPAYISKNLSWWLLFAPFLSEHGFGVAASACASLLSVNLIYFIRARTEEKHLRADPAYEAYARWIAEHGFLAKLLRHKPWLIMNR